MSALCYMDRDIISRHKYSTTHWCFTRFEAIYTKHFSYYLHRILAGLSCGHKAISVAECRTPDITRDNATQNSNVLEEKKILITLDTGHTL